MADSERSANIPAEWIAKQVELSEKVSSGDAVALSALKYVAGVDISFDSSNERRACAYLCVLEFDSLKIVYEDYQLVEMDLPYVCGFLAFREVNHYLALIDRLKSKATEYLTNCIILVDGFGVLHERKCGSASHLGVLADLPTIGVAKKLVKVDELDERKVRAQFEADASLHCVKLVGESGTVHGMAIRSALKKPIYVSIGHKVSLETTVSIVRRVCKFRIPEPIRIADIRSKLHFGNPSTAAHTKTKSRKRSESSDNE